MQLTSNLSKSIILAVVSFGFLITWNVNTITEITNITRYTAEMSTADTSTADMSTTDMSTAEMSTAEMSDKKPKAAKADVSTADSIWSSISYKLKLDHRAQSAQVQAEIRKIVADQAKFNSILHTAGPYIYYIYQQTQMRGLPAELALIPIIESEFNPNDRSKAGASGLWQLMPQTAHELGVKMKSGYDGRRNVIASTKAALAYFNDLGILFKGNWYLAIAAYNCGQVRVKSAMRKSGSDSFWNLPLPQETKYYVPRLLAIAAILKNPKKYGVKIPLIDNKPFFSELEVKKSVSLAQVAKTANINLDTLHALNPDYDRKQTVKKEATVLLVPVNKVSTVKSKLADSIKIKDDAKLATSAKAKSKAKP